jgi:hypothetical protein
LPQLAAREVPSRQQTHSHFTCRGRARMADWLARFSINARCHC